MRFRAIFLRFSFGKRTFRWVFLEKKHLIFLAYWTVFVPFSLGFRQENARYLAFSWGKTLFSLHIGRFSCRFPKVFARKTHVTLGFVEKKLLSLHFGRISCYFSTLSWGKPTLPWLLLLLLLPLVLLLLFLIFLLMLLFLLILFLLLFVLLLLLWPLSLSIYLLLLLLLLVVLLVIINILVVVVLLSCWCSCYCSCCLLL